MSNVVVDVEHFHNNVIKELGICVDGKSSGFSFRPPYPYNECTPHEKRQNSWNTRRYHMIGWNSGDYGYKEMKAIIKSFTFPDASYFAKGRIKCTVLSKLFGKTFHNLEDFDCPSIGELHLPSFQCDSYPGRHRTTTHCAQRKAQVYGDWLIDFFRLFEIL